MTVWRQPEAPFICIRPIPLSCTLRNSAFGLRVRVISRHTYIHTSKKFHFEKWISRTNNNYLMWSWKWKCLYYWRQPLSLGGPQGRYTIHTMLCNSSLVVPKWFLYKAQYWFFHFKAQGNNSSWKFRINFCKDRFQLNKTITIRIIISKLFVMIQW